MKAGMDLVEELFQFQIEVFVVYFNVHAINFNVSCQYDCHVLFYYFLVLRLDYELLTMSADR